MTLSDIFPKSELTGRFEKLIKIKEMNKNHLDSMERLKPNDLFQIGITIWDKYCNSHPEQDKFIFAKECQSNDPNLYKKVHRTINEQVLFDFFYGHAAIDDELLKEKDAVELILAHIYPSCLMIVDVMLINPYQPVVPRKYDHQHYKGLGLFGSVLDKSINYCHQHGLSEICLTAADMPLKKHFEQYGFEVPDTWMGQAALKAGRGIPMSLRI